MLKEERRQQLARHIESNGLGKVGELAQRFRVSEMTIRRDLESLASRGLVQRIHGGAIATGRGEARMEPPMLQRISEQSLEKRRIAQATIGLISEGDTVFIGSGTTALAVAEALQNRQDLTVVTNALTVANALVGNPQVELILIGGFLRRSELSLIGHYAEQQLNALRVDKLILGARGVDPEFGLSGDHPQELMTDRAILGIGDRCIVVADHSKFGFAATSLIAPIDVVDVIVTDKKAPRDTVRAFEEVGIQVIQV